MKDFSQIDKYFDKYIEWNKRLRFELPFLKKVLEENSVKSVLDIGCGSGRHAVALAKGGYIVTGVDPSDFLIGLAKELAEDEEVKIEFIQNTAEEYFSEVSGTFDCILMLGNLIPLLDSAERVRFVLSKSLEVLDTGGIVISHLPNYSARLENRDASIRTRVAEIAGVQCVLVKALSFPEETDIPMPEIMMHMMLIRPSGKGYEMVDHEVKLIGYRADELRGLFSEAGFSEVDFYGSMGGESFDSTTSHDCVIVAKK